MAAIITHRLTRPYLTPRQVISGHKLISVAHVGNPTARREACGRTFADGDCAPLLSLIALFADDGYACRSFRDAGAAHA
jgi:hypothetical protein